MISVIMTISLCTFLASLPALAFDKNLDVITSLSATVYSMCFCVRYYADALTITIYIVAVTAVIYGVIRAYEWVDGDDRDCVVILPGQTIVGGDGDES